MDGMNRVLVLFALSLLLVGCMGMKVRVSDGSGDYSIYKNGSLSCSRSDSCEVFPSGDAVYLEARRNNVVYSGIVVYRGCSSYAGASGPSSVSQTNDILTFSALNTLSVASWAASVGDCRGYFPQEVVIPVGPRDSLQANFPWDKPITSQSRLH